MSAAYFMGTSTGPVAPISYPSSSTDYSEESTDYQETDDELESSFADLTLSFHSTASSSGIETPSSSSDVDANTPLYRGDRRYTATPIIDFRGRYDSDTTSSEATEDDVSDEEVAECLTPVLSHTPLPTENSGADVAESTQSKNTQSKSKQPKSKQPKSKQPKNKKPKSKKSKNTQSKIKQLKSTQSESTQPGKKRRNEFTGDLFSASFGPRSEVLDAATTFLNSARESSTEYNLTKFLVQNDEALNSKANLELLLRTAIACAQGGRISFEKFSDADQVLSIFKEATNKNNTLNVSMWNLLGHYIIRSLYVSSDSRSVVRKKFPSSVRLFKRTRFVIGGNHIWEEERFRGSISGIKWKILDKKSEIPYSRDFGLLLVNLVGLNLCLD